MNRTPTLKAIFIYPVKGCAAVARNCGKLDNYGLLWDRRWMVVNMDGVFQSQRQIPAMALIQPTVEETCLRFNAPGMESLDVPLQREPGSSRKVKVWDDVCDAWDEGGTVATWFSDFLGAKVRLVRMADTFERAVDSAYASQPAQTSFTDGYPLLIASEASLGELNRRLLARGASPVPMSRFRPSLVLAGCTAFEEDTWRAIQIGAVPVDVVKPCGRCAVTTVDQATGTIPDSAEPLATLNTFRKQGSKVMFAQNAIHRAMGGLRVGDVITVKAHNTAAQRIVYDTQDA